MRRHIVASFALLSCLAGCSTPSTDSARVEPSQYSSDNAYCDAYARAQRPGGRELAGVLLGGLAGQSIAASSGNGTRWEGVNGGVQTEATIERIKARCMSERGVKASAVPDSSPIAANLPVAARRLTGKDTYQAERTAKQAGCGEAPLVSMDDSGPGFEVHRASCPAGTQMMIRCEFGNCRRAQ